jgi:uncharacterized protein (TIGR02145 family)
MLALTTLLLIITAGCKKKDNNPPPADPSIVTDIDGNIYHKITIGSQVWMLENLKVTHYRNGNPVTKITGNVDWSILSTEAYCDYTNDAAISSTYGRLYNWYAVSDSRNLAPAGWHIPTEADLITLGNYLGGNTVDGGKMKESGTTHWQTPNTGASNSSGFTALPGGSRDPFGLFDNFGFHAYFWSSTEFNGSLSRLLHLYYDYGGPPMHSFSKSFGFSVRCVKD